MLKLLPADYIDLITLAFNSIFNSGKAPSEWNVYQIIFIGKKDKERIRPIIVFRQTHGADHRNVSTGGQSITINSIKNKMASEEESFVRRV